jgi:hypothetical protein
MFGSVAAEREAILCQQFDLIPVHKSVRWRARRRRAELGRERGYQRLERRPARVAMRATRFSTGD